MSTDNNWAIKLFNVSPLKQEKYKQLTNLLGDYSNKTCLDIGSDNGVISLLLRKNGGKWSSADLLPETVESIKSLVKEDVYQIDGLITPFGDKTFDSVAIVDFLEHIKTDKEFISEMARIIKREGELIVNVPNPKEGFIRKIRYMIGQTDEAHGHVRAGYNLRELKKLLSTNFEIKESQSYSRIFSILIDTFITGAIYFLKKGAKTKKGAIVTGKDIKSSGGGSAFKIYKILYPFINGFSKLDKLVPFLHGNMLIVRAVKK